MADVLLYLVRLADRLEQLNRERQKIEADLMSEAVEAVKAFAE